jgi:hypothetical protein
MVTQVTHRSRIKSQSGLARVTIDKAMVTQVTHLPGIQVEDFRHQKRRQQKRKMAKCHIETQLIENVIISKASVSASKQLKVQHKLAIEILQKYGHDYCRLEPRGAGGYRCLAWSVPLIEGNGLAGVSKRGTVRTR